VRSVLRRSRVAVLPDKLDLGAITVTVRGNFNTIGMQTVTAPAAGW